MAFFWVDRLSLRLHHRALSASCVSYATARPGQYDYSSRNRGGRRPVFSESSAAEAAGVHRYSDSTEQEALTRPFRGFVPAA